MTTRARFQTPAPRGGVPLWSFRAKPKVNPDGFQTPAPRGGVPLANTIGERREQCLHVSNPCASGRCSSEQNRRPPKSRESRFQTPAPRGGVPLGGDVRDQDDLTCGFKPLRLGAVFLCLGG